MKGSMCGITGFIDISSHKKTSELENLVKNMACTLNHRGPDDGGVWTDEDAGIALGHKRLSIIDLSSEGHQPMASHCGRYVIAFNGEIYNFKDLRSELESSGYKFRGHSDTEVMLCAISCYGVKEAVQKFNGMFAFALWDRKERILSLARDRIGEKPLYYGWSGNVFLFASELKAIRAYPGFDNSIDRNAIALFMRYNCIPAPHTIYKDVFKLPPAAIISFDMASLRRREGRANPYWSLKEAVEKGKSGRFKGSSDEAVGCLERLLSDSVKLRMESDVPLGVFLSGGIDSSLVTALMQAQSTRKVKTFTVGFNESGYNEAEDAKLVARHLGTEHTEFYVTPAEAMSVIKLLPDIYDEPFSDSSQIPTYLVSRLTRQKVTVSLSGDGGDEVFSGYNRYFWVNDIWRKIGWAGKGGRGVLAKALTGLSPDVWGKIASVLSGKSKQRTPGDKIHKLADVLSAATPYDMYTGLVSHWKDTGSLVLGSEEPLTIVTDKAMRMPGLNIAEEMMYKDTMMYLPDDILVKVDRSSMAVSLESRAPFLDHRVVEFAWQLPLSEKIKGNEGKQILRKILYKHVPRELIERPKMGFAIPIDTWLRGPLKSWAEGLLDETKMRRDGFLNYQMVKEKWDEHISGKRNWQHHLWDVLMFQAWYERWK